MFLGAASGLLGYSQRSLSFLASSRAPSSEAKPTLDGLASPQGAKIADPAASTTLRGEPSLPLPTDYGVYAVDNGALAELHLLAQHVPDRRIAMSAPLSEPSQTILSNGKAKFVLFRRDLATNAPDRMDVRVVARVVRALTFDSKGKPRYSPVSDVWDIRDIAYQFRVRPIPGSPEMLLVQAEPSDFTLPPGRYVLALKTEGYDFTVTGKITDPAQCLERTDASNGEFYSDCPKQ